MSQILSCAFSPDGRRAIFGTEEVLKLWDLEAGIEMLALSGHLTPVTACKYSPDGRHILSGSYDGTLKIWDAKTGVELATLAGHSRAVTACAYSPDGQYIVSGSFDRTLKIWKAESGVEVITLVGHSRNVTACAYSPDGKHILSGSSDKTLKIWDAGSGVEVLTLVGHSAEVTACAFSPDGKHILSSSWDGTLKIWDSESGAEVATLSHASVTACIYSPDGRKILAASSGHSLNEWDAESGRLLKTLDTDAVQACAYSQDGRQILAALVDGRLKKWDAETGVLTMTLPALSEAVRMFISHRESNLRISSCELKLDDGAIQLASKAFKVEPPTKPALPIDENVQFTVYRPRTVRPAKWYTLLAFAHLSERRPGAPEDEPDPIAAVKRQAEQILGERLSEYKQSAEESSNAIPQGNEITFKPFIEGVEFNPSNRSFRWEESIHREEFKLRASASLDGQTARGWLRVFLGPLIIAQINLALKVDSEHVSQETQPTETESARPLRKVFASYSHKDRAIVELIEETVRHLGIEYLRDVSNLRAGEEWSPRLREMIEEANTFELFWSTNSMYSPFVREEYLYALSLSRRHFVIPVYWETPFPEKPEENLPPEELRRLHFEKLAETTTSLHLLLHDGMSERVTTPELSRYAQIEKLFSQEATLTSPGTAELAPPESMGSEMRTGELDTERQLLEDPRKDYPSFFEAAPRTMRSTRERDKDQFAQSIEATELSGTLKRKRLPLTLVAILGVALGLSTLTLSLLRWSNIRSSSSTIVEAERTLTLTIERNEEWTGEVILNATAAEDGALYLFGEGANQDWYVLFPNPGNNEGDPRLQASRTIVTNRFVVPNEIQKVRIWVVWAVEPIPLLDDIVHQAELPVRDSSQLNALRQFLSERDRVSPEPIFLGEQVILKGRREVLVYPLQLKHGDLR